jgi:hypothetical protein
LLVRHDLNIKRSMINDHITSKFTKNERRKNDVMKSDKRKKISLLNLSTLLLYCTPSLNGVNGPS